MLKSLSTSLIQRGILGLAAGAIALHWPGLARTHRPGSGADRG